MDRLHHAKTLHQSVQHWFKVCKESNTPRSQCMVGNMLIKGDLVPSNRVTPNNWSCADIVKALELLDAAF
jgi:hypothetical protein